MGLTNMSILAAASLSVTGGSALVFADDGVTIANGIHLIVPADADYQTRRQLTMKFRPPTLNPGTNVYGKDKKTAVYVFPQVLASGQLVFNTLRLEREVHPSFAGTDAAEMNKIGAQLLTCSDTAAFWATGSRS